MLNFLQNNKKKNQNIDKDSNKVGMMVWSSFLLFFKKLMLAVQQNKMRLFTKKNSPSNRVKIFR